MPTDANEEKDTNEVKDATGASVVIVILETSDDVLLDKKKNKTAKMYTGKLSCQRQHRDQQRKRTLAKKIEESSVNREYETYSLVKLDLTDAKLQKLLDRSPSNSEDDRKKNEVSSKAQAGPMAGPATGGKRRCCGQEEGGQYRLCMCAMLSLLLITSETKYSKVTWYETW